MAFEDMKIKKDVVKDGYIYLLQDKKYIDDKTPIFKIGRTQNVKSRFKKGYKNTIM